MMELLLALALVAIAALTLVALSFTSIASRQKAEDFTNALLVAEEQLALAVHQIETLPPADHANFWDTTPSDPYLSGLVSIGGTDYNYMVETSDVSTGTVAPNRMKKLDVTVWWWSDQPGQARAGSGQLQYSASRLVREVTPSGP